MKPERANEPNEQTERLQHTKERLVCKLLISHAVNKVCGPCSGCQVSCAGHVFVSDAAVAKDVVAELCEAVVYELLQAGTLSWRQGRPHACAF